MTLRNYLEQAGATLAFIPIMLVVILVGGYVVSALGAVYKVGWHFDIIRYAVTHGMMPTQIIVPPMPHNCEFLKAPIGGKYCTYIPSAYPEGNRLYVN